jgi:hypothetical protein
MSRGAGVIGPPGPAHDLDAAAAGRYRGGPAQRSESAPVADDGRARFSADGPDRARMILFRGPDGAVP